MTKKPKPLALARTTIRALTADQLDSARGGTYLAQTAYTCAGVTTDACTMDTISTNWLVTR
jgi:hypothetical protein